MTDESEKKHLTLRIDADLHKAASRRILDLDTSFQALISGFLKDWTHGEGQAPVPVAGPHSSRHREDHETLEFILLEGDRQAAESIRQTLKLVAEAVRARSAVRPKRKTG